MNTTNLRHQTSQSNSKGRNSRLGAGRTYHSTASKGPGFKSKTSAYQNTRVNRSTTSSNLSQPTHLLSHPLECLTTRAQNLPQGYVFVPKGDVYISRHCRTNTLDANKKLFIVYSPKDNSRLGLGCPAHVYIAVSAAAESTADARREAVEARERKEIDVARETLHKHFPCMPEDEMGAVLAHGFEKGSGRVGRAGNLDVEEKVRLVVWARARHVHTAYDESLRALGGKGPGSEEGRLAARKQVQSTVERVVRGWEGKQDMIGPPIRGIATKEVEVKRQMVNVPRPGDKSRVEKVKKPKQSNLATFGHGPFTKRRVEEMMKRMKELSLIDERSEIPRPPTRSAAIAAKMAIRRSSASGRGHAFQWS